MKKIMTMDEFNNLIRNLNIPEEGDPGHVDDHKQIATRLRIFPKMRTQRLVKTAENEWTLSAGGEAMTGLTDAEIDDNINEVIQDNSTFVVTHNSEIYEPFSSTPVNTNVSVYVGGAEAYSSLVTSDDIHDLIMTTKNLESRLEALESDSATLNTTVSQLGEDVTTLSSANSTLEGQVSTLESDNASLNATVSGLETDLGSLSSANDTLSSTVSTLEGNVATLTSDKEALEGQVSTLESTIGDLASRLEALENPTSPE